MYSARYIYINKYIEKLAVHITRRARSARQQKRTGHRSVNALKSYERVTPFQNLQISKLLEPPIGNSLSKGTFSEHFLRTLKISQINFSWLL